MKKIQRYSYNLILIFAALFLFSTKVYAAPGGMVAKEVASTPLGKVLLVIVCIILSPFILYNFIRVQIGISNTKKALIELSKINNSFRWTLINERAHGIITQVYSAWRKADIEKASEWMTDWYWQNQKTTVLEQWENDGLKNICKLNKIQSINPLYAEYIENEKGDGEGSRIVIAVKVNLQDYVIRENTGDIIEGDTKNKDLNSTWTLLLENGQWKLSLIEASARTMYYVKMKSDIDSARELIQQNYKYRKSM